MTVNVERNNGLYKLAIEGEMTVLTSAELKRHLLYNLENCSKLEIDLSQVSEMDSAGFQLLFLTKREAIYSGKIMRITSHSEATSSVLELYNMHGEVF
ncbi:MAG: STAS domain-containing protein [Nitrospirae bacterium]|nr:STAS domain-containing protein [Nitrospirota bacterium]